MPKHQFKEGDLVQLQSGGPKMTVIDTLEASDSITCAWFAGARHERAVFPPTALKKVPSEPEAEKPK